MAATLGLRLAIVLLELRQREGCKDRSRPSPEIFGAEILLSDLPDVMVHVAGVDGPRFSVVVQVLEEFVTGDLGAALDCRGYAPVLDLQLPLLARLAREIEPQDTASDCHVLATHGGQAVGLVLLGVFGVADPDQRLLEKADDRREHLLAGQTVALHVGRHAIPQGGERCREHQ